MGEECGGHDSEESSGLAEERGIDPNVPVPCRENGIDAAQVDRELGAILGMLPALILDDELSLGPDKVPVTEKCPIGIPEHTVDDGFRKPRTAQQKAQHRLRRRVCAWPDLGEGTIQGSDAATTASGRNSGSQLREICEGIPAAQETVAHDDEIVEAKQLRTFAPSRDGVGARQSIKQHRAHAAS